MSLFLTNPPLKADPISIRLFIMLAIASFLVLIMGGNYWLIKVKAAKTINEISRGELTLLADSLRSNIVQLMNSGADMNALDESLMALQRNHPKILDLRVIHGQLVTRQFGLHEHEKPRDEIDRQGLTDARSIIAQREENGVEVLRFVYPLKAEKLCLQCHEATIGDNLGAFSLTLDTSQSTDLKRQHDQQLLMLTVAEIALLLLLLFLVLKRLIFTRLDSLIAGANRVASGHLDEPIPNSADDEMGVVIHAFNDMSGKLSRLIGEHEGVIREQALELTQLIEASEQISADLPLPGLLRRFANSLTLAAQVTSCRIAMLEEDSHTLSMKAEHPIRPLPDGVISLCNKNGAPNLWHIIEHKKHRLFYPGDPLSSNEHEWMRMDQSQVVLCVPIIHQENVYGIAILMELREEKRQPIDMRKVNVCLAMVSQVGAAIHIAKLYNHLFEHLMETVLAMAETVEKKSPWTAGHSKRVTHYALAIAKEMGWPHAMLESLRITGLLHDLGKIGVPGRILNKAGRLTNDEYAIIKKHPNDGAEILSNIRAFQPYIPAIRHHHEWFNGNGYPDGLKGAEIPVEARILAVADAFDAMTADRPYRKGLAHEHAMQRLIEAAGEQFDPEIVAVFKKCPSLRT